MQKNFKQGVSLITVLLFMLVATIAATATFKWLNSEGRSSAARLMRSEARQAALAGITSARTWMTYHGNETGAIIRQFRGNGHKPVHLNNVLGNNIDSDNQKFDVWLVGAESNSSPYTVKILSTGESRNGTKHSEVAIMKISGLYQVKVPEKKISISFDRAFFGKTKGITGDDAMESAIVNGDFGEDNNVPSISKPLLVTGDFSFQGSANMGGDLYVGGNFRNKGSIYFGNVDMDRNSNNYANCKDPDANDDTLIVYIGGSVGTCEGGIIAVCGDLYVGGSVPPNCDVKVAGNFTVNGHMERGTDDNSKGVGVKKNMVFTDRASWTKNEMNYFSSTGGGTVSSFKVGNNLVLPPTMNGKMDLQNNYSFGLSGKVMSYTTANTILLNQNQGFGYGQKPYGVFVEGTTALEAMGPRPQDKRYFSFSATKGIENRRVSKWSESDPLLKAIGDEYWSRLKKMYTYQGLIGPDGEVPVPILLNNEDLWTTKTMNKFCEIDTVFNMDDNHIQKINECYAKAGENELYNGFLILEWNEIEKVDPTKTLDGKFVLYARSKLGDGHMVMMPATTENSVVLLFLESGAGLLKGDGNVMNYFIYSRGDIDEVQKMNVEGCVIMDNGSTLLKYQGHNNFKYKAEVVEAVQSAGFIIGNEEFEKLANKTSGATTTSGSSELSDTVYVAVSSQLKITIESEYKNEESYGGNTENVKPSILIMPRIIYLPRDAKGSLSDYYNVVNLNGANEQKNPNNVSCSPTGLPAVEKFKLYGTTLPQDVFSCNYTSNNYEKMGFYVVVSGSAGDVPEISFDRTSAEITKGHSVLVNLRSRKSKPATVDIYQSREPEGWTVTGATPKKENADGSKLYTMPVSGNMTAFEVKMDETASEMGSIEFQLVEPCENCTIAPAGPTTMSVVAEGSFTVERREVGTYCSLPEHKDDDACKPGGELHNKIQAPDCGSLVKDGVTWVTAEGVGCNTDELNRKWFCSIYITTPVTLKKSDSFDDTYCEVIMPPNNKIISAKNDKEYLYASIKRKQYNLHIEFNGAENSGNYVDVSSKTGLNGEARKIYTCRKGEICDYPIYAGNYYELKVGDDAGSDHFTHFSSEPSNVANEGRRLTIYASDSYSIVANYNDHDTHCFYEDFAPDENNNGFTAFCDKSDDFPRCIDVCFSNPNPGQSCKISEAKHWAGLEDGANPDWVMVYDNRQATSSCHWDYSSCNCSTENYKACRLQCRKRVCTTVKSGDLLEPSISNNYIAANAASDASAEEPNGSQSVILNTKENGSNGTLTSIFSTAIIDVNTVTNDFSNSGFIFRSNDDGSEYYSLSVYGKHAGGAFSPYVYAKLCYVKGQTASDDDGACVERFLSTSEWNVSETGGFTNLTKIALVLKIQSNVVTADLQLDGNSITKSSTEFMFDLGELFGSTLLLNDAFHEHSGFKLSNKDFKLYDISWSNSAYGDNACWDHPKLVCSFKTNYLGGVVPQNEYVTPWVGVSSYTMNSYKKCQIKYYYNGCDNTTMIRLVPMMPNFNMGLLYQRYQCFMGNGLGYYWENGSEIEGSNYRFATEGKHGYYYQDIESKLGGFAMDAKVSLECPPSVKTEVPSSLLAVQSCGEFYVGDIMMCSKNIDFLNSTENVVCTDSCSFAVSNEDGVNVRKSKLLVGLNNPNNYNMRISFTDKKGILSSFYTTSMDGNLSIDVNGISNEDGFDPQHVMRVNIKVIDGGFVELNQLKTSCPNALSINSCKVQYNGTYWDISADVNNADYCTVEKPVISNAEFVGGKEPTGCQKTFRLKEENLYSKGDFEQTYEFTIKASKGSGTDQENEELTCDPYKLIPLEIACNIDETKNTVKRGAGVPPLNISFTNCPEGGCSYSISFEGENVASGNTKKKGSSDETYTFNDLNTPSKMLRAGEYYFTVSSGGKENSDCSFVVEDVQGKAEASNCVIDEDTKVFTAKVNLLEGESWSGQIYVTDQLGFPIGGAQQVYENETVSEISVDLSSVPFSKGINTIKFIVNGDLNGSHGCEARYTPPEEKDDLELECPSLISVDGYSETFEMTPSKVVGCDDGKCFWSVSGDALISPSSGYTSGPVTVTESYVSSSKEYTFTLGHEDLESRSCRVVVERTSDFELDCNIATQTDVEPGETINVQPYSVTGCNSNCSYRIEMQNSSGSDDYISVVGGSGSNYNGERISFKGANSGGTKRYRLTVTDAMNSSKSCLFDVVYANSGCRSTGDDYLISYDKKDVSLNKTFVAGCHDVKIGKLCKNAKIEKEACRCEDGMPHKFKVNGREIECGIYFDNTIPNQLTLNMEIPENCSVYGDIKLYDCEYDPDYVGVGTKLTYEFVPFGPGANEVYTAAFSAGHKLYCNVDQTEPYDRVVGSIGDCEIRIPAYNTRNYGSACELLGDMDYILNISEDAPSDLTCKLDW